VLLTKVHYLEKAANIKPRILKTDEQGNFLIDRNNPDDVEWYENDKAAYTKSLLKGFCEP